MESGESELTQEITFGLSDWIAWAQQHGDEVVYLGTEAVALFNRAKALYDTMPGNTDTTTMQLGAGELMKLFQLLMTLKQLFEAAKKLKPQG